MTIQIPPTTTARKWTFETAIEQIEFCDYEAIGGWLIWNDAFIWLKNCLQADHLAALAEKEEKIQAAMEAGKMLKEQRDKAEEEIVALTDENKQLRELVDCAEDIVELYGASRPGLTEGQEGWKKEWLRKARQALRDEEVGNE